MASSSSIDLQAHVQSALQCITSSPSSPDMIKQAQDALMQWEESHADEYVVALLSLISLTSDRVTTTQSVATLRLAAVLSLKSAIARKWKDKGRGKVGASKILLSEHIKTLVRQTLLSLILTGKVEKHQNQPIIVYITNSNDITAQQLELVTDRPLQTNTAALLSKVARMDLPLKFQDLIPTLVDGIAVSHGVLRQIQQQSNMQQEIQLFQTISYNIMNCLENVLSEISTQRLLVDKKYRNAIALQYLRPIVENGLIPSLQAVGSPRQNSNIGEEYMMVYATVTSRVVSHMMLSSFSKLAEDGSATITLVDQILTLIHSFLTQWLPYIMSCDGNNNTMRKSRKEIIQVHCDLIVELQKSHPIAFVRYLKPFLELFHSSLMSFMTTNNNGNILCNFSDRFTISCLLFLANVVGCSKYGESDAAQNELRVFFTPSVVQSLSRTLLCLFSCHIYPNQVNNNEDDEDDADRVQWQDDPEGFYQYEVLRSSEDDVGCASQNLLLALVESSVSSGVVIPWLVELLTNAASQRVAVEIEGGVYVSIDDNAVISALPLGPSKMYSENVALELLLQWDAIYTAAGLACSMLENAPGYAFSSWYDASLGPCLALLLESKSQIQQLPILRRRIIWLMSCNANQVNISSPLNPLGMLVSTLSASNDICVRLTAVQSLDAILPQCEDVPILSYTTTTITDITNKDTTSILHSVVESTVPALYQLTNECAEVESRSACLDLLSNIITYVGVTGGSHALTNEILNAIVAPLSSIWANATDQNLLLRRNVLAILSCVAAFVGSEQITVLYPLALPLIDDSFAHENVFLVEDALKIWCTIIRLSKTYDLMLGKLFVRAAELSKDLNLIMILMRITEHYIHVGAATFLNDHATTIQTVLTNVVGEVRPRGTAYIYLVIEALLCAYPVEGGSLLHSCGALKTFIEACASSFTEQESCEPDRVIVLYLSALARVLLATPSMVQVLLPSGTVFGKEQFISLYINKFQVAGNGPHGLLFQKLWTMLLLSFYPPCPLVSCSRLVLAKSNDVFAKLLYVLKNANPDGSNVLSYEIGYDEDEDNVEIGTDIYETLLLEQRGRDIVVITLFQQAVSTKMNGLSNELGDKYQEFLSAIESDTLQQLQSALAG